MCEHRGGEDFVWAVVGASGRVESTHEHRDDAEAWLTANAAGGCWDIIRLHWCGVCLDHCADRPDA
jgi:hypothetical protein